MLYFVRNNTPILILIGFGSVLTELLALFACAKKFALSNREHSVRSFPRAFIIDIPLLLFYFHFTRIPFFCVNRTYIDV
ncbi:hypothetical protein V1511DRAFT_55454 [Dipodascopsis uninucleata]